MKANEIKIGDKIQLKNNNGINIFTKIRNCKNGKVLFARNGERGFRAFSKNDELLPMEAILK